jgi:multicomponent Na+:H+ antiporter subunit G
VTAVAVLLLLAGTFFLAVSAIGLFRLPDFYTRAHAAGKSETLGALLILAGLAVYNGASFLSLKLLLILALVALTNPTAVHAMTRAALRSGVEMWTREEVEEEPELAEPIPAKAGIREDEEQGADRIGAHGS